jgi:hypothetical protein
MDSVNAGLSSAIPADFFVFIPYLYQTDLSGNAGPNKKFKKIFDWGPALNSASRIYRKDY